MANSKISALTALTGASVDAANDVLPIIDVSAGAAGSKKITVAETMIAMGLSSIQQANLTTVFTSTTNNAWEDVTGLSLVITTTSATQKVRVTATLQAASDVGNDLVAFRITRNTTPINVGTSVGSRVACSAFIETIAADYPPSIAIDYVDSPGAAQANTYQVQIFCNGTQHGYVNRAKVDTDNTSEGRTASNLIAELKGL